NPGFPSTEAGTSSSDHCCVARLRRIDFPANCLFTVTVAQGWFPVIRQYSLSESLSTNPSLLRHLTPNRAQVSGKNHRSYLTLNTSTP
ncbi:hypothetical protein [truncated ORF], partial [Aspergillus niger]|uniref:Uncharacterized protein n=2 Tax=Aspergillus niger TaxID=5061 RepID=A0AAJ8E3L1_ASPNG